MRRGKTAADRFSASLMAADAWRMWMARWPAFVLVLLVLAVLPTLGLYAPWGHVTKGFGLLRLMGVLTVYSARNVAIVSLGLAAISGRPPSARGIRRGIVAALAMDTLASWTRVTLVLAGWTARQITQLSWLASFGVLTAIPLTMFWGLITSVAIGEQRGILSAARRSAHLLHGLRWRIASLYIVYVVAGTVLAVVIALAFRGMPLSVATEARPWIPGLTAATMAAIGLPFELLYLAMYLQARRLADGPNAAEIEVVFA